MNSTVHEAVRLIAMLEKLKSLQTRQTHQRRLVCAVLYPAECKPLRLHNSKRLTQKFVGHVNFTVYAQNEYKFVTISIGCTLNGCQNTYYVLVQYTVQYYILL